MNKFLNLLGLALLSLALTACLDPKTDDPIYFATNIDLCQTSQMQKTDLRFPVGIYMSNLFGGVFTISANNQGEMRSEVFHGDKRPRPFKITSCKNPEGKQYLSFSCEIKPDQFNFVMVGLSEIEPDGDLNVMGQTFYKSKTPFEELKPEYHIYHALLTIGSEYQAELLIKAMIDGMGASYSFIPPKSNIPDPKSHGISYFSTNVDLCQNSQMEKTDIPIRPGVYRDVLLGNEFTLSANNQGKMNSFFFESYQCPLKITSCRDPKGDQYLSFSCKVKSDLFKFMLVQFRGYDSEGGFYATGQEVYADGLWRKDRILIGDLISEYRRYHTELTISSEEQAQALIRNNMDRQATSFRLIKP